MSGIKLRIFFVGGMLSVSLAGCSSSSGPRAFEEDIQTRRPKALSVTEGAGVRLSEALNANLKTDVPTAERKAMIQFIGKAMKTRRSLKTGEAFKTCDAQFNHAPECAFLKPGWVEALFEADDEEDLSETETALKASQRNPQVKMTRSFLRRHTRVVNALVKNIRAGKVDKVKGQIQGDYYRALKRFKHWIPDLEKFTTAVTQHQECLDPELYTYLGMKAEEFFPDEARMKNALDLFMKGDQCGIAAGPAQNANKYVQLSRFRLGLLSILAKDCKKAEGAFGRLAQIGASDYSTRALYWTAYCARSESKRDEFISTFDELFRTNPLGYHTLSINNGDSVLVENLSRPTDPLVRSRTEKDEKTNTWIGLIEDFDREGNRQAVYSLLAPARTSVELPNRLEPGVRLYLATFSYRAKDMISLFRMLDSVFRTQSEYVVDSTLKLFYPLKYFDLIASHSKKIDPILVASLVRQESAFQVAVKSSVGAVGLMQLMPRTAKRLDRKVHRRHLVKPEVNLRLGVRYFEHLVNRYDGDVELALAAYNAGAEVVDRWQKRYPVKNRLLFLDLIPYAETRNYVTLIGRNYYWYSKLYADEIKNTQGIAQSAQVEFRGMKSE